MSSFCKLSQTLWHCQYHILWCPKYRFRVLEGSMKEEIEDRANEVGSKNYP